MHSGRPVQRNDAILTGLLDAGIDFIVVGMEAGVLQGAGVVTDDVDIVHRRTPENARALLTWLLGLHAYNRADFANRHIAPNLEALLGHGQILLMTDLGQLDVLCELHNGDGYEDLLPDTIELRRGGHRLRVLGLPRIIVEKRRANRAKDRIALPSLIATLEEQTRRAREADAEPICAACGKPIRGTPITFNTSGKPPEHYHPGHAPHGRPV